MRGKAAQRTFEFVARDATMSQMLGAAVILWMEAATSTIAANATAA